MFYIHSIWQLVFHESHSPSILWEQRANLSASVPHWGIPWGKSLLCVEADGGGGIDNRGTHEFTHHISTQPTSTKKKKKNCAKLTCAFRATICSLGSRLPSITFSWSLWNINKKTKKRGKEFYMSQGETLKTSVKRGCFLFPVISIVTEEGKKKNV